MSKALAALTALGMMWALCRGYDFVFFLLVLAYATVLIAGFVLGEIKVPAAVDQDFTIKVKD
ncbi:hypothetical protein [Variovorax guangxiensis]|uniref:Uncharacterized protein n=1 Tax=Variovorax guangxiensis TaxID=1775474 RepID=A0A502DK87_9BURK|nr:hypothetical protein [Variovorax guangxiensis]TPG21403.1 hypothetical protein EAH83_17660 [Variovorax ginsengisoli]TPG25454.1 hypothetical protein EAH82_18145 [Variovorax guangxiensis]